MCSRHFQTAYTTSPPIHVMLHGAESFTVEPRQLKFSNQKGKLFKSPKIWVNKDYIFSLLSQLGYSTPIVRAKCPLFEIIVPVNRANLTEGKQYKRSKPDDFSHAMKILIY